MSCCLYISKVVPRFLKFINQHPLAVISGFILFSSLQATDESMDLEGGLVWCAHVLGSFLFKPMSLLEQPRQLWGLLIASQLNGIFNTAVTEIVCIAFARGGCRPEQCLCT